MAKLRKKIVISEQNQRNQLNKAPRLRKKLPSEETLPEKEEEVPITSDVSNTEPSFLNDNRAEVFLTEWFFHRIGERAVSNIQNNPNFSLPYLDENIEPKQWLARAIKTLFKPEDVQFIKNHLLQQEGKYEKEKQTLKIALEQKEIVLKELSTKLEQLNSINDNLRVTKHQLQKKLNISIPAEGVIERFFGNNENTKGIYNLFNEAMDTPGEEFPDFLIAFLQGWEQLQVKVKALAGAEQDKLATLNEGLKEFLAALSGRYIPQRRALLENIARYTSNFLTDFTFVSPEETLKVNPDIHQVKGVGGENIREGKNFAVIRRQNGQTYQYAEVEVY